MGAFKIMCLMSPRTFTISSSISLEYLVFLPLDKQLSFFPGQLTGSGKLPEPEPVHSRLWVSSLGRGAQLRPMFFWPTPDMIVL